MKKIIIGITSMLVVTFSFGVNATLISTDLYTMGDGLLTLDTETGIEWLNQRPCTNSVSTPSGPECGGFEVPTPSGFTYVADTTFNEDGLIGTFLQHAGVDAFFDTNDGSAAGTNNTYQAYQHLLDLGYFSTSLLSDGLFGIIAIDLPADTMPIYEFIIDENTETAYIGKNAFLSID